MSRITFNYIEFKNFMSYGNNITHIDFENSITQISGNNGAGKTSILLALSYCLFGKTFNKATKSNLINKKNNKELYTKCEFIIGNDKYVLERGEKPSILTLSKNGILLDIDGDSREWQKKFELNILHFSLADFTSLICLGYNYTRFFELGAQARRDFIENILNIGKISEMAQRVKELNKADSDEKIKYNMMLFNKEKLKQEYIELLNNQTKETAEFINETNLNIEKLKSENSDLELEIEKTNETYSRNKDVLSSLKLEYDELNKLKIKYNSNFNIGKQKKNDINKEIEFFEHNKNCPVCKQHISEVFCENKIKELNTSLKNLENKIEELSQLDSQNNIKIELLQEKITDVTNIVNESYTLISVNKTKINENKNNINKLTESLKKVNTSEFESKIKDIDLEIQEFVNKINKLEQRMSVYKEALDVLSDKGVKQSIMDNYIDKINKEINDYITKLGCQFRIEIDSGFNETIFLDYRDEVKYESLSAGQKQRVDMSIFLAFKSIAQMRSEISTNILLIDEILDNNLDVEGINSLLDIFKEQKNMNIFVISHRDISDKINNIIKIKKEKYGFSEVSYETID